MTQTASITVAALEDAVDPYPLYRRLRDESPLMHDDERDYYVVTRFDDVYGVLGDHGRFSEVRTLINQLLDRYVGVERAGASRPWLKLGNFRGLAHVPVRLVAA